MSNTKDKVEDLLYDFGLELLLLQDQPLDDKYDQEEEKLKKLYVEALLTLIAESNREAEVEQFKKLTKAFRDILAENFHYRILCGEFRDPSGKVDVNELFVEYQELEPDRQRFADFVENRISALQSQGEGK